MWMPHRAKQREYMDDHTPPQKIVDEVYWFLRTINRWFGGTRATLQRFDELSRSWAAGERVDVLDVACGGADQARALVEWGAGRGFDLRVTAVDISPNALDCARRQSVRMNRLLWVCADVHGLPFPRDTFDYVTCALFFHHLSEDDVIRTLRSFDQLARRGIVVNDLMRVWRLYAWSWVCTRPFNKILRHDGPLSVRRSFRPQELAAMAQRAGVTWLSIERHFGHRITLAGDRHGRRSNP